MKKYCLLFILIAIVIVNAVNGQKMKSYTTGEDTAVTALLRHQTEMGSDAGQRGDQATMESFLDPKVLFSGGDGSVGSLGDDSLRDEADSISLLIKSQTQAFRDAGQRGDGLAMRRYLDEKVLFTNEDGKVMGWHDLLVGVLASPLKGDLLKSSITQWVLHHYRDVAFSSFIYTQTLSCGAQMLNYQFLSVETWVKRSGAWKLVGGQTIPLHQDPPLATLPQHVLNEYTGSYSAGLGSSVIIVRHGDTLFSSANGGKATPLNAEARDVFFRPGYPSGYARPRINFQRDSAGQITGYSSSGISYVSTGPATQQNNSTGGVAPVLGPLKLRDFIVHQSGDVAVASFFHDRETNYYGQVLRQTYRSTETWIKHGAQWKMITSQGRAMQADPPATTLPVADLNAYAGSYTAGPKLKATISSNKHTIAISTNGQKAIALQAEARDVFFISGSPRMSFIFQRDGNGNVITFLCRQDEHDLVFTKG